MKRRLIFFGGVLGLLMVLNVGAALAHHGDNAEPFAEAESIADGTGPTSGVAAATTPGSIPVGTALGFVPGLPPEDQEHPGLVHGGVNGFQNLSHNPNCPLHYQF
jgi:hypothetical protein